MFDLTPLYRSTVGFDRLAGMLDEAASFETPTYPPYNIERLVGERLPHHHGGRRLHPDPTSPSRSRATP